MWRITQYHCDTNGQPYGAPYVTDCYTQELMESYKNPKFVEKIEEYTAEHKWVVVWTRHPREVA